MVNSTRYSGEPTSRGLGVVLGDLAALGFDARWDVLSAADCGAPHLRERIWIVARRRVPNAVHGGQRQHVQPVGQRRRSAAADAGGDGQAQPVANTDGDRQQQPARGVEEVGHGPGHGCADVAHADSAGCGAGRRPRLHREGQPQAEPVVRGADVPDPGGPGLSLAERQELRGAGRRQQGEQLPNFVGGLLNPTWVEKLMGWPDEWTSVHPMSHVKMCFWLMGFCDGEKARGNEVLRVLRIGHAAQEVQREVGRPVGVQEAAVLLAQLCEHAKRPDEARVLMACAQALEGEVRGMRLQEGASGSPRGPEHSQQRATEHSNAVQALSRLLAHHGKTYWQDGRWEDAVSRVVAPGATGLDRSSRANRIRCLGNGQVPRVAAAAWLLLAHDLTEKPQETTP